MSLRDNLQFLSRVGRRTITRAAFRMSGAKYKLINTLMPVLEEIPHEVWADHCGGTGVVSWNKEPCKKMVYNDRHSAVADFYICLREDRQKLEKEVRAMHPKCRQIWQDCRDTWVNEKDPYRRAAKWYYMAVNSVGGKRQYYGTQVLKDRDYIEAGLESWHKLDPILRKFEIENLDVLESMTRFDSPLTLHYVDPPYVGTDQETFEFKWGLKELQTLVKHFKSLEGTTCLSHCPHPWLDSQGWDEVHSWTITSTIAKNKSKKLTENLYVWEG